MREKIMGESFKIVLAGLPCFSEGEPVKGIRARALRARVLEQATGVVPGCSHRQYQKIDELVAVSPICRGAFRSKRWIALVGEEFEPCEAPPLYLDQFQPPLTKGQKGAIAAFLVQGFNMPEERARETLNERFGSDCVPNARERNRLARHRREERPWGFARYAGGI